MAWNDPENNPKKKDPWSGGKQSPPDLDEALKELQKKISGFFGGGKGTATADNGGAIGLGIIFIVIVLLWILSGIFTVDAAEEAVVLRFGKYSRTLGPGLHWVPRFIESYSKVNVQSVASYSYTSEMLSRDENIVSVAVAVQYRIENPNNYLFNVINPIESLQQATASALRQTVGHHTLNSILTVGREKIRAEVRELLVNTLERYKTGLQVVDVVMQPAKAPEEVKSAFDDAIKAQEDEQRYINKASAYAARVTPTAEGAAKRMLQEAEAYKQQIILKAKGDVSRFNALLPQYRAASQVTRERLYLDAIESVLSKATKILMDVKGNQSVMYLPLDQLLQRKAAEANATQATTILPDTPSSEDVTPPRAPASIIEERNGRDSYLGRRN